MRRGEPYWGSVHPKPGDAGLLIPSLPASQACCTRKIPAYIVLEAATL